MLIQQSNIKPIQHYNLLLNKLRQWGPYQVRLFILMIIYWLLSGILCGVFQLQVSVKFSSLSFYIEECSQIIIIITSVILAMKLQRSKIITVTNIIIMVGGFLVALGSLFQNQDAVVVGQFLSQILHYSIAFNLMMIVIEFFQAKYYSIILIAALAAQNVGLLLSVKLSSLDLSQELWAMTFLIPSSLFYILSSLLIPESPRFWISQNIMKAQKQLYIITQMNNVKYEVIEQLLQRQFFWHQVALTKYSLLSLFNFKSINFNTYIFCVQAFFLGVICKCPDFIQHLKENTSFVISDELSIIWTASFQLFALVPAYLASVILKRKNLILSVNLTLLILIALLVVLEEGNFEESNTVLLVMAIFGLSSFFSMVLFYYIFLSAIEFYPHTIRTLAMGVIFSFYLLGKLLFSMHIQVIQKELERNQGMMELVLSSSLMLLLHSWLMQQTFLSGGRYDLLQLQKVQFDQS